MSVGPGLGVGYDNLAVAAYEDFGDIAVTASVSGTHAIIGGGGAGDTFVDSETPGGVMNGVNTTFTLANAPSPSSSLMLQFNGQTVIQGVDFTLSGSTITWISSVIPDAGSGHRLRAWYRY